MAARPFTFYECFSGGGMVRLGLGAGWTCLAANDFDPMKAAVWRDNFGSAGFVEGDIWQAPAAAFPGHADLAWASSPCQDLSLAGARAGLAGGRSSALMGFWRLMAALAAEGRAPRAIVIENVTGLISSAGGADFTAVCLAAASLGYAFGALEIDAAHFLPQSRRRLFFIAVRRRPSREGPSPFATPAILAAKARLPAELKAKWIDWPLAAPPARNVGLAALLDDDAQAKWDTPAATRRMIALMAPLHRARLEAERKGEGRRVGAVFRRVRQGRQRAEARFDGLAGCLRTPRGGSSRQSLIVVEAGSVRSRLISGREAARLMGAPETYRLPKRANAALQVFGDAVAVPVVRFLAERLLEPLLAAAPAMAAE
jgi:DNA (cytosine-5)-methyltransferase 1